MTGRDKERELVQEFEAKDWATLPSGGSGSGTDFDRPDLAASKSSVDLPPLGIEAKTSRDDAYTIKRDEAWQLKRWCAQFGAVPVVAFYWIGPPGGNLSYGGWWFQRIEDVRESPAENADGGHHLRPRRRNREDWRQLEDLNQGLL